MKNEEREIKIKLEKTRFESLEKFVSSISMFVGEKIQKDEYFDNADLFITNLNRGLRVRWNGTNPILLEFKSLFYNPYSTSKKNPWYIEEIALPLPLNGKSVDHLNDIFVRLGLLYQLNNKMSYGYTNLVKILKKNNLKPKITVLKLRHDYKFNKSTITFDEIENLGYFLEVESDDPISTLKSLGIIDFQVNRIGYNDMIATQIPNYLPNDIKQQRFRENPTWNVLPTETALVGKMLKK